MSKGNTKDLLKSANSIRTFYSLQYEEACFNRGIEENQRMYKTKELIFQILLRFELHSSIGVDPVAKESLKEIKRLCESVSILLIHPGIEQWLNLVDLLYDMYYNVLPLTVEKLFEKLDVKAHSRDKVGTNVVKEYEDVRRQAKTNDKKKLKTHLNSKIERTVEKKEKVSLGSLRKKEKRQRSAPSVPQTKEKKIRVMTKKRNQG